LHYPHGQLFPLKRAMFMILKLLSQLVLLAWALCSMRVKTVL